MKRYDYKQAVISIVENERTMDREPVMGEALT